MVNMICQVKNCYKTNIAAHELCHAHYRKWRLYGSPLISMKKTGEMHGLVNTKEYKTWSHIKGRCFNKNNSRYKDYGGRGITMCTEWANSFLAFYKYVGRRPQGKTLDRINNDGNYEPGNVRWADNHTQAMNRRTFKNNQLGVKGIKMYLKKYKVMLNYPIKDTYLGCYDTLDQAIMVRMNPKLSYRYEKVKHMLSNG